MNNNTKKQPKSQLCFAVETLNKKCERQFYEKHNQGTVECERDYELLLDEKGGE